MSEHKSLQLTIDDDKIAWLSIDVSDESMNVLKADLIGDMEALLG